MAAKNDFTVTTAPREAIITRTINAPRELVFDAFTKAEHLRKWFGPHGFRITAESDPRVGGKYRITMHGTDALPEPYASEQYPMSGEYLELKPPDRIVYTSDLQGHPESWQAMIRESIGKNDTANFLSSVFTITFDDMDGKTKLTIREKFETDAIRDGYLKMKMGEGWSETLDKLEAILTGIVIVERTFNAPVDRVWEAISNNDAMKQWYFKLPEFRPEVGFEFEFEGVKPNKGIVLHKCRVTEVISGQKLAYTWQYEEYKGISTVTIELFAEGKHTKLRLTHSGLDSFIINNDPALDAHNFAAGWADIIGRSLKEFVEMQSSSINRTMAATRILNAPRELVWKVITEPGHIKQWWGPNGFTLTTHEYEMRVGGEWNFTMHGPDGTDYKNEMVFEEIVPKERIVFTHGPAPKFQMFIQLSDRDGKTEIHWRNVFENEEDYKRAVEVFHAVEGLEQNLGRLEAYFNTF
ncbi:MAG TPA: SRPBCC domain-containing protein [Candidatus Kapabacteria bacterium]|nr:SRPBCC domain-containing protein [Candidatus Kapabacteria bacterium]